MTLAPEVEASYAAIIDAVLASADLQTISAKMVRKELAAQVGYDITSQRNEINRLIGERFDKFCPGPPQAEPVEATKPPASRPAAPTSLPLPAAATNGIAKPASVVPKKRIEPESSNEADSNEADSNEADSNDASDARPTPPPKKVKHQTTAEEDDAAFAARLQAEENKLSRARSTRGGGAKRKPVVKKKEKKEKSTKKKKAKSATKVKSDDDSDLESGAEKKEVKRTGGFHKPMNLSQPLAELLGETQLSRPQCVKKIWDYIKAHDLQDPTDKRQIRCDDGLRTVFKTDKVHMFTMNKILNQNLYALDE